MVEILPDDEGYETPAWQHALERVLDRHEANADRRHGEVLAAIVGVMKAMAEMHPAASAALSDSLKNLGNRIEEITAADQKLTAP